MITPCKELERHLLANEIVIDELEGVASVLVSLSAMLMPSVSIGIIVVVIDIAVIKN